MREILSIAGKLFAFLGVWLLLLVPAYLLGLGLDSVFDKTWAVVIGLPFAALYGWFVVQPLAKLAGNRIFGGVS